MKGSAMAAGAVMLDPFSSIASHFNTSVDDTIKVALIGCGGRGTGAANQAMKTKENVKLVAMADVFEDRLKGSFETLTKVHGESGRMAVPEENKFLGFDSYKKAIDLADVVILTTPPGFRPWHFEYAVQQGKHIFMEKPVATDAYGIRKVLENAEIAKARKLNVVVGLQRHYQSNYREAVKRINDGMIGDIISGQVYWNDGGVWVNERKPGMTEMEYQVYNWYYFTWICGDHILEQHIHNIDVANWFIGEYPVRAQGMGGRQVRTGKEYGEIFDHHFVEFEYPGGAIISSQCRHQRDCMSRVSETFQGTKGSVYTNSNNKALLKNYPNSILYEHAGEGDPNPYQVEHDELFAAIKEGKVIINDAENGAKSTMTAIMGRMATYSGKVMNWDEALASNKRLVDDPEQWSWKSQPPTLPDENGFYPIPAPGQTEVL